MSEPLRNSCSAHLGRAIFLDRLIREVVTHVPLNAPTGFFTGAGAISASSLREVWNERVVCWRVKEVAGRAKAAARSAEGRRAAISVVCEVFGLVEVARSGYYLLDKSLKHYVFQLCSNRVTPEAVVAGARLLFHWSKLELR